MRVDIDPSLWGGPTWRFLESIVHSCPVMQTPDDLEEYETFILTMITFLQSHMPILIPCQECRTHYQNYLQDVPLETTVVDVPSLWQWMYGLRKRIYEQNPTNTTPFLSLTEYIHQSRQFYHLISEPAVPPPAVPPPAIPVPVHAAASAPWRGGFTRPGGATTLRQMVGVSGGRPPIMRRSGGCNCRR